MANRVLVLRPSEGGEEALGVGVERCGQASTIVIRRCCRRSYLVVTRLAGGWRARVRRVGRSVGVVAAGVAERSIERGGGGGEGGGAVYRGGGRAGGEGGQQGGGGVEPGVPVGEFDDGDEGAA